MPSDHLIAQDQASWFKQYEYYYNGKLYVLIPDPPVFGVFVPYPIRMYKSTDGGLTWGALTSYINGDGAYDPSGPVCLIGTKLYVWYIPVITPGNTIFKGLAYFDFTTETFTLVTTTGNTSVQEAPSIVGSVASQLYTAEAGPFGGSMALGQYVSNAYSSTTLTASSPYQDVLPELLFLGSSGIVHSFYMVNHSGGPFTIIDLGYLNIVGGVISGTVGGQIVYPNFKDSLIAFNPGSTGTPLQIGSNIYFSFYDPYNQKLRLMVFDDSASPTFTVSDIEPSWSIVVPAGSHFPTGGDTNVLAYFGGILYCFYTNTSSNPSLGGDGKLYVRISADLGASWSASMVAITHLDPHDGTPIPIAYPETMQLVAATSPPAPIPPVYVSYAQQLGNSQSPPQNQFDRFSFAYNPGAILSVWKSTNAGATWAMLSSFLSA